MTYFRTIYLADTDAAGVVYFASLLSICHEAYEASLKAANLDLRRFFGDASAAIPIAHAEIDFFRPLHAGDHLEILLRGQILQEDSFEIEYQILLRGECVARARTRHVCINPQTRQKQPLSESMLQWLVAKKLA